MKLISIIRGLSTDNNKLRKTSQRRPLLRYSLNTMSSRITWWVEALLFSIIVANKLWNWEALRQLPRFMKAAMAVVPEKEVKALEERQSRSQRTTET